MSFVTATNQPVAPYSQSYDFSVGQGSGIFFDTGIPISSTRIISFSNIFAKYANGANFTAAPTTINYVLTTTNGQANYKIAVNQNEVGFTSVQFRFNIQYFVN